MASYVIDDGSSEYAHSRILFSTISAISSDSDLSDFSVVVFSFVSGSLSFDSSELNEMAPVMVSLESPSPSMSSDSSRKSNSSSFCSFSSFVISYNSLASTITSSQVSTSSTRVMNTCSFSLNCILARDPNLK